MGERVNPNTNSNVDNLNKKNKLEQGNMNVINRNEQFDQPVSMVDFSSQHSNLNDPNIMNSFSSNAENKNMDRQIQQLHQQQSHLRPQLQQSKNFVMREYFGGAAAAAYNAMKHDYYVKQGNQQVQNKNTLVRSVSDKNFSECTSHIKEPTSNRKDCDASFDVSSLVGSPQLVSANTTQSFCDPKQRYESLKLHHMKLLEEMKATALKLQLYEQQRLSQAGEGIVQMKSKTEHIDSSGALRNKSCNMNSPHFRQYQTQVQPESDGSTSEGCSEISSDPSELVASDRSKAGDPNTFAICEKDLKSNTIHKRRDSDEQDSLLLPGNVKVNSEINDHDDASSEGHDLDNSTFEHGNGGNYNQNLLSYEGNETVSSTSSAKVPEFQRKRSFENNKYDRVNENLLVHDVDDTDDDNEDYHDGIKERIYKVGSDYISDEDEYRQKKQKHIEQTLVHKD